MERIRCTTCYRGALEVGRVSIAVNCILTIAIVFIECLVVINRNIYLLPVPINCLPPFLIANDNSFNYYSLKAVHPTIYFLCLPYVRSKPNNSPHLHHLPHNKFSVSIYSPSEVIYTSHNSPGYLLVLYTGNACQPSPMRLI